MKRLMYLFLISASSLFGQEEYTNPAATSVTKNSGSNSRILFGKFRTYWLGMPGEVVETGKFKYAFRKPCYMDLNSPLKERKYKSVGLLYFKFEKYCKKN